MQRKLQSQDGGWGWMVVAGSFIIKVITVGFLHSIGILYVEMKDIFSVQSSEISWIGALQTGCFYLTAPIITACTHRFSPRIMAIAGSLVSCAGLMASAWTNNIHILYVTLGILPGTGFAMIFLSSILIINEYFRQKRAFAIGIAEGGAGVGISLFGPLTHLLVEMYSFKGAVILLSAITLNCLIGGALFYPFKENDDTKPDCVKLLRAICNLSLLLEFDFILFLLSNICTSIAYWTPLAFLPDLTVNLGFSKSDASTLIMVFGISSSAGRIFFALLIQRYRRTGPSLYAICIFLAGVSTILLPCCTDLTQLHICVAFNGISSGGLTCITVVLVVELFKAERMSRSLGLVYLSIGTGSLIGGPLSTNLSNLMSSGDFLYYFSGGVYILGGLLLFPLILQHLFCKNEYSIEDDVMPSIDVDTRRCSVVSLTTLPLESSTVPSQVYPSETNEKMAIGNI